MEEIEEGRYPSTAGVIAPSDVGAEGWMDCRSWAFWTRGISSRWRCCRGDSADQGGGNAAEAGISMAKWIGWLVVVRGVTGGDVEIKRR